MQISLIHGWGREFEVTTYINTNTYLYIYFILGYRSVCPTTKCMTGKVVKWQFK
jgi:hypothetical protein